MILVCGEALIDMVPLPASPEQPAYVAKCGGSLFNVAMGLGRLEVPVGFFGRLSLDPFGRMMRRQLEEDGVDCRFVLDGAEPSTLAIVFLEGGAEPVYTFHDEGAADRLLRVEDVPATLPDAIRGAPLRVDLPAPRARRQRLRVAHAPRARPPPRQPGPERPARASSTTVPPTSSGSRDGSRSRTS